MKETRDPLDTSAYEEQRRTVARCALEWCRAYIVLYKMAADMKLAVWQHVESMAPNMALKPNTSRIDVQLECAKRLMIFAMNLGDDTVRRIERANPNDENIGGQGLDRHIGEIDAYTTANPLYADGTKQQEPLPGHVVANDKLVSAFDWLIRTEPVMVRVLRLLDELSASETKKSREWQNEGRSDRAELCGGRASILNRIRYQLTHGFLEGKDADFSPKSTTGPG